MQVALTLMSVDSEFMIAMKMLNAQTRMDRSCKI